MHEHTLEEKETRVFTVIAGLTAFGGFCISAIWTLILIFMVVYGFFHGNKTIDEEAIGLLIKFLAQPAVLFGCSAAIGALADISYKLDRR